MQTLLQYSTHSFHLLGLLDQLLQDVCRNHIKGIIEEGEHSKLGEIRLHSLALGKQQVLGEQIEQTGVEMQILVHGM